MVNSSEMPLDDPLIVHTTPATGYTGERCISVRFDSSVERAGRYPVIGSTTYAQAVAMGLPERRMGEFKDYICTRIEGSGDEHVAWFGLNKTAAEANQRYHWEIKTEHYPWEGVLLSYKNEPDFRSCIESRNSGGGAFYQQKWNTRYKLLAPIQGATDILYEYFISPTKYTNLRRPTIQQPLHVPAGHLPGDTSEPVGNVLVAKRIRVVLSVLGSVASKTRLYEPTIPAGRVRHIIDEDQNQLESGLYIKLRKTAIPPVGGRIIRDR